IRSLVPYPMHVRIPAGTFLVSQNPASQNMVVTRGLEALLKGGQQIQVFPAAACANSSRTVPGGGDVFTIERSPEQVELTKLMTVLNDENITPAVRQAAVWIVTDDSSYAGLGTLVRRRTVKGIAFGSGEREI